MRKQTLSWNDWNQNSLPRCGKLSRMGLALTAVALGLSGVSALLISSRSSAPRFGAVAVTPTAPVMSPEEELRTRAWGKVAGRLQETEQSSRTLANQAANRLEEFFNERKERARPFAEEVLSLRGKWELVKSKLSSANRHGHERYVRACFERKVFTPDELQERLQAAVAGYISGLQGLENQFLVAVRADLSDGEFVPLHLPAAWDSDEAFRREYAALCQSVLQVANQDLQVMAGRELTSFVACDVSTAVVVRVLAVLAPRLGLSAGILGAGATSGWVTFGASIPVAILLDRILDWVLHKAGYDPEAKLARQVRESLTKLQALLLDGDPAADRGAQSGLRTELLRLHEERTQLREAALRRLFDTASQP